MGIAYLPRSVGVSSPRMEKGLNCEFIVWTNVYVDAAYSELCNVVRCSPDTLISDLVEKKYGRHIAGVRQTVEAVGAPEAVVVTCRRKPGRWPSRSCSAAWSVQARWPRGAPFPDR
jgi:GntR family transcriptional regulator